jgi:hypothetical protein
MAHSPGVIVSTDLGSFFRSEVSETASHLGVEMSQETEYYVVNLLCEYSKPNREPRPGDEALALIYKRALEAERAERIRRLRDLGDLSLYVAGFFADFIQRSLVDIDYYIRMGGTAYTNVSDLMGAQPRCESFAEVFEQLATKFTALVDVLTAIAERSRAKAKDDADLLRLYDRWVRTRSERVHRLLVEKGLLPTAGLPSEYVQ